MDPRLARLLDKQSIEESIYAYCRAIDRRDFDGIRACYHPDATDEHGNFAGTVDAYLEWVEPLLARYRWTMHFIGNVLIEFGDDEHVAAAESYGIALHRSEEAKPYLNLISGFRYLDRFERRDAEWKIARRVVVSEWSIPMPAEAWWELPDSLRRGQPGRGDALYALLAELKADG
jgi:3-phenylpropionate/cinnamic acid dioxygenase small subunit